MKDGVLTMDAATAYFLKRYYPHVIKWWLVVYIPEAVRIWPSKAEKEAALRLEAKEAKQKPAIEQKKPSLTQNTIPDAAAYNAATGSYSGLYGQGPVDESTKAALDAIMNTSNNQNTVDSLLSSAQPQKEVILPPEHKEIVDEANAIYNRLMREAAEDEAKKQAEIEAARQKYA